jgi:copper resistance protein C
MRRVIIRLASCCAAAVITICGMASVAPRVALAHAVLVSAQPEENSTVAGPDVAVLLRYNSRIDMEHSTLMLLAPAASWRRSPSGASPRPECCPPR